MKILSIETSGKICAAAITEDNKLICEKIIEDENTHSVKLMPLINELLKQNNMKLDNIDLFACDVGPGSFTGIRIGVSTIKAFLDVTNKKTVGITSLENLAYNVEENGTICSMIDAKNNNVYYGIFEKEDNNYMQIEKLAFDNINKLIDTLKSKNKEIIFVGNASKIYKDVIKSKIEKASFLENEEQNKLNARNIGVAAFNKKNNAVDSNNLIPIYLRQSSAERLKK